MNTLAINKATNAVEIWFNEVKMFVWLDDGREIAVSIDGSPGLGMPPIKKEIIGD